MLKGGCRYGTHRVLNPEGTLPQPANKLDNTMEIYENEILIDVKTLNIDSASYTQIKQACGGDAEKMKEMILSIVQERGKMQNPVTGSGGMLIGTVREIGPKFLNQTSVKVGDKIATLVSLSLTPLKINSITNLSPDSEQVDVDAQAILFESGLFAVLPDDIPECYRHIRLDACAHREALARLRCDIRRSKKLCKECTTFATDTLAQAKALHDQLEQVYNPHVDFDGVYEEAENHIKRLFAGH